MTIVSKLVGEAANDQFVAVMMAAVMNCQTESA